MINEINSKIDFIWIIFYKNICKGLSASSYIFSTISVFNHENSEYIISGIIFSRLPYCFNANSSKYF